MYVNLSIISITILLLLYKKLHSKNIKKQPPSPPSLPIIGHLHLLKKPLHHALAHLSDRYGPLLALRFGARPVLVVSSAAIAEKCFTKNDVVFANRVQLPSLKHLTYNFTNLGFSNNGPYWRNLRRITTVEVLSSHRLSLHADILELEVNAMIRRLFNESNLNGKRPNDSKEANKFKESVEETFKIAEASNIGDFLPFLGWMDLQGVIKKSKVLQQYRDGFLQKMLDEHRVTKEKELGVEEEDKTMLGNLISMQKIDPDHYSDQNIKALVIDLLTAGTDTTSNTIEWAMALLLNNPDKMKKAQVEMDKHLKHECLLQESDISNLPYLEGVIKETYRLYPGGPLLFLRGENNFNRGEHVYLWNGKDDTVF